MNLWKLAAVFFFFFKSRRVMGGLFVSLFFASFCSLSLPYQPLTPLLIRQGVGMVGVGREEEVRLDFNILTHCCPSKLCTGTILLTLLWPVATVYLPGLCLSCRRSLTQTWTIARELVEHETLWTSRHPSGAAVSETLTVESKTGSWFPVWALVVGFKISKQCPLHYLQSLRRSF